MISCKKVIALLISSALYKPVCAPNVAQGATRGLDFSEKWNGGKADFLKEGFAPMLENVVPGVVTVMVSAERPLGKNLETLSENELHWILESGAYPKPMVQKVFSSGTGFVIKSKNAQGKDAYIVVTNYHVLDSVVMGSGVIHVAFQSGEVIPAKVIAVDTRTDLAALSIETDKKIPYLRWGKSSKLRTGNWVLAIGAPGVPGGGHKPSLTLSFSVTHGIVSNVNRVVPELSATHITSFVQTDAPLNPGNSGGPLVNINGEVVGVNTMIFSSTGGSHGMNLAIPSDLALPVISQLAKGHSVQRGYIGIQIGDDISVDWAKHLGMPGPRGVIIDSVVPNTPAEKGGLKDCDVILEINGVPIFNHQQARALIASIQPGKMLKVRVWRVLNQSTAGQTGREMAFDFLVGQLPVDEASKKPGLQVVKNKAFGVSFRHIGAEAMARMRMHLPRDSVVVVDSIWGSTHLDDTLLPGDVVLRVNETPVMALEDVQREMDLVVQNGGKSIKFFVQRYVHGHGYREMTKLLMR